MNKVNLHIHTTASDGIYDYSKIIYNAVELGLQVISITDHDNVDFINDAVELGKKNGIIVISGVELTANYSDGVCHILGYNINVDRIKEFVKYIKRERIKKAKKMINIIRNLGYKIDYDEVLNICSNDIIGRRDIAKVLVEKKYFPTVDTAIESLFSIGKPAYIKTQSKSIEACVKVIKDSGGIAVLAHPWTLNMDFSMLKQFIIKYNFDGIEVYNHNIQSNEFKVLSDLAESLDMYITCGTDFHGYKDFDNMLVDTEVNCEKILNKIIRR